MGSPAFAVPSLEALASLPKAEVVGVVTQPDRRAGRGSKLHEPEVKTAARSLGIPVVQPESLKEPASVEQLRSFEANVFVVAAYGKILSAEVLSIPHRGSINVHSSLLPRWRGASPVSAAILAGDQETGISVMEMVRRMDAGPVVSTAVEPIRPVDTTGTLERRLAKVGASLLSETLDPWFKGSLQAEPQDEDEATYCRILKKGDGQLNAEMDAEAAARAVRAHDPWPGAFVEFGGKRLSIWRAHAVEGQAAVGTLTVQEGLPLIALKGGMLVLDEVQLPDRRRILGSAFVNGLQGQSGGEVSLA